MKGRRPPKPIKSHLASAGSGGQRMTKPVTPFSYVPAALRCCLPGELPPPRTHHPVHLLQALLSHHPLLLPHLGFVPRVVEYWPLWDTLYQLEHRHQLAVHHSLPPPGFTLPAFTGPGRQICVALRTFSRPSKHERNCVKVGMAAGASISTPAPPPPFPFLLASFHMLPTPM